MHKQFIYNHVIVCTNNYVYSHGKLPWSRLFQDAIDVARNGFEVSLLLRRRLKVSYELITTNIFQMLKYVYHLSVIRRVACKKT